MHGHLNVKFLLVMIHWSPFKPIILFIKLFPLNIWNVVHETMLSVRWSSPYNMPWRHRGRPEAWLHSLLILALDVGGWSLQCPSCFTLRKRAGWAPEPVWIGFGEKKPLAPARYWTLDCPARSKPLYQLRYPGSFKAVNTSSYTAGVVIYTSSGRPTWKATQKRAMN